MSKRNMKKFIKELRGSMKEEDIRKLLESFGVSEEKILEILKREREK